MKHLPLLIISLLIIISCEEEEDTFDLVGTWNIASITNLDNKDCTVDADSTDDGDLDEEDNDSLEGSKENEDPNPPLEE